MAFVCVGRDVTEQKQAEQEIRQLNVELELRVADRTAELAAMNRELETFADSVAHDLRAPILTISLYTQTLIDKHASDLGTEGKEPVDQILAAARRMNELIDDLLRLARASRAELRREPTDLSALARSIAGDFRKAEPLRKVDFVIADGLQAYGDSGLLRLALQDLLENAWKFTGKQAQATIEVGAMETDGGEINLFVRDDGAGFDMRYADKLFLPFERLHSQAEFEGTGVGLATVYRIIERHGGRVWADAEVGRGATFYFTLPAAAP